MSELLLVGVTEELQPLAFELESAGFHITACSLADAVDLKSTHELCDALIFNLMDRPVDARAREVLRAGALPERAAVIAILRPDQLPDLEPSLPLDELVVVVNQGSKIWPDCSAQGRAESTGPIKPKRVAARVAFGEVNVRLRNWRPYSSR